MKPFICVAMIIVVTFTSTVQAGWFKNFCAKHIIADDPNEAIEIIEALEADIPTVVRLYRSEGAKVYWRHSHRRSLLQGLGRYLRAHNFTQEVQDALDDYQHLEGE